MGTITTKDGTEIYYKDWGKGQPIVFSHGWPLSADDWDTQMLFFLKHGYRVIAHDRRGHGRSTQVSDGHDMDHYAEDLAALTAQVEKLRANPLYTKLRAYRARTYHFREKYFDDAIRDFHGSAKSATWMVNLDMALGHFLVAEFQKRKVAREGDFP
jgi:Alpha/beta hydrolase family